MIFGHNFFGIHRSISTSDR
ncbi:hypothetical protein A4X06_0g8385, partial [Tilletia controversa]